LTVWAIALAVRHIALAVVALTGGLLHIVGWGFYLTDPWKRRCGSARQSSCSAGAIASH